MFSDDDIIAINQLKILLEDLKSYCTSVNYGDNLLINKSLNVLNQLDKKGIENIEKNLTSAFRMMADNGFYGGKEDEIISEVYKIIDENVIFHK